MTIRVLGLDLAATSSGIASSDGTCRTIRPHADASDRGRRLNEIVSRIDPYLRSACAAGGPVVAVLEGPALHGVGRMGALITGEVRGAVKRRLFELGIVHVEVPPTSLKLYATGKGNAGKDEMVAAARAGGAVVANDDEADAFLLHALGRSFYSATFELPFRVGELTEVRRKVRASIRWPEVVAGVRA